MTRFSTTGGPRNTGCRSRRSALPARVCAAVALAALGVIGAAACKRQSAEAPSPGAADRLDDVVLSPVEPARQALPIQPVRHCARTCSGPADCTQQGAPALFDASHFACTDSRCQYTGCKSDAECTSANGPSWVCEAPPGATERGCVPTCNTAADCTQEGAPALFDAGHFACTNNRCQYTGCKSNAECAAVNGPGSVCDAVPGLPFKDCVASCSTPADCTGPGAPAVFDASHFACTAKRCEYTGCKSDAECTSANGPGWVCE